MACRVEFFLKIVKQASSLDKDMRVLEGGAPNLRLGHMCGLDIIIGIQRVNALRVFWDLEKTVLHETRVSGTVLWSPTNANSPTYTYISQKTC